VNTTIDVEMNTTIYIEISTTIYIAERGVLEVDGGHDAFPLDGDHGPSCSWGAQVAQTQPAVSRGLRDSRSSQGQLLPSGRMTVATA